MKNKFNLSAFLNKPFVKNIVSPVLRGALQTIPGGGILVQAGRNVGHELSATKEKQPHSYLSIAVQIVGLAVIVYAFYTRAITVEQVLSLIGFSE